MRKDRDLAAGWFPFFVFKKKCRAAPYFRLKRRQVVTMGDATDTVEAMARQLIKKHNGDDGPWELFMAFVSAVDWKNEPWLWALGFFHVFFAVLIILTRHDWVSQLTLLSLICTHLCAFFITTQLFTAAVLLYLCHSRLCLQRRSHQ
jgi:hypothetical protein